MSAGRDSFPTENENGKRKRRNSAGWDKTKRTKARNSAEARLKSRIACEHDDTHCILQLSRDDIQDFWENLSQRETVDDQNSFLLPFINPYTPVQKRPRNSKNPRNRISVQYLMRKLDGKLIVVCLKTFLSLIGMSHRRINGIARHFYENGEAKKGNRGGSRLTNKQVETADSIVNFIKKLPVQESHYGRGTSGRQYLSPELSISKLWRLWKEERASAKLPVASLAKFTKIFNEKFNLSFRNPRVDVCSQCELLTNRINGDIEAEVNKAALELHKATANRFYEVLRESKYEDGTLTLAFDMQQNQPLPKTNVTEAYYARQLWLYNFTVVIHDQKDKAFTYTWLESESGKGSNEITSALEHFFRNVVMGRIKKMRYNKIQMFCDSCPGQNKNAAMIAFLVRMAHDPTICKYINRLAITYPIKGHSYMPPDRVFGRIEQKSRKMAVIKTPAQYQKFLEEEGTVFVYQDDWFTYDYKILATSMLRNLDKLKMQKAKTFLIKPRNHPNIIQVSQSYSGEIDGKIDVLKPKVKVSGRNPKLVPSRSHVSEEKKKDVLKLLEFIDLTPLEKTFYTNELAKVAVAKKKKKDQDE